MTTPAARVVTRFKAAAGYTNQMNAPFFSLWWGKSGWSIEESDAPQSGLVDMFDQPKNDSYVLPNIQTSVKSKIGPYLAGSLEPQLLIRTFHLTRDDKGPEVRHKIVEGYKSYLGDMLKGLREPGGDVYGLADKFEAFTPFLLKKLVWKKV